MFKKSFVFAALTLITLFVFTLSAVSITNADGTETPTPGGTPTASVTPTIPNQIKVEGVVTSITGTIMTVAGQQIETAAATIERGVAVGREVDVYLIPVTGGAWFALRVELDDDEDDLNEAEIEGIVQAYDGRYVTIGGRVFDTQGARFDDDTVIVVGAYLEVKLVSGTGGVWTVREVERDDDEVGFFDDDDDSGDDDSGDDDSGDDDSSDDDSGGDDSGDDDDD